MTNNNIKYLDSSCHNWIAPILTRDLAFLMMIHELVGEPTHLKESQNHGIVCVRNKSICNNRLGGTINDFVSRLQWPQLLNIFIEVLKLELKWDRQFQSLVSFLDGKVPLEKKTIHRILLSFEGRNLYGSTSSFLFPK